MSAVDFRVLGRVGVTVDGEPQRLRPMETTVLAVLLGVYVAVLVWMRRMAAGNAIPRFLGASVAKEQVR